MKVVLFDGVCNLCNSSINWLIDRDSAAQLKFSSLQSAYGQSVLHRFHIHHQQLETIIYLDEEKIYFRSEAVLRILKQLGGIYAWAFAFMLVPRFLRDGVYNIIATYRYRWFGKRNICRIPESGMKDRFIA